ncbi:MAG TPA: hypothetical protein VE444_07680 [Gaiellaceae bacterium]|nr:hypothetical protein [Gaiellaceae bacterium]
MSAVHPLWLPLGELLVERELLSQRQLELALAEQKRTGKRLGEVLLEYGFLSQQALAATLLDQVGLPAMAEEPEAELREVPTATVREIVVERNEPVRDEPAPMPTILRVDAEPTEKRRWWKRDEDPRVVELERTLADFERRSHEIQTSIAEIRGTLRAIRDTG